LDRVTAVRPIAQPMPARPKGAYLVGPESYGVFKMVTALQTAGVPTFRAAAAFDAVGRRFAPGTFVIPPTPAAEKILQMAAVNLGLPVHGVDVIPAVDGFRLKPETRV